MRPVNELTSKKRDAIRLRLNGLSLAQVKAKTGLSVPTIIKAVDAFKKAGWKGVEPEARGRKPSVDLNAKRDSAAVFDIVLSCSQQLQRFISLGDLLETYNEIGKAISKKTLLRRLERAFPYQSASDIFERLLYLFEENSALGKASCYKILVMGVYHFAGGCVFYTQDRRGERRFFSSDSHFSDMSLSEASLVAQLDVLVNDATTEKPFCVVIKTDTLSRYSLLAAWQEKYQDRCLLLAQGLLPQRLLPTASEAITQHKTPTNKLEVKPIMETKGTDMLLTHLQRLEAESIQIMREVVAEADNPVMLYSIGKDSAVMLHIAMKAFYPSLPPFPLLHVDTRWKFREMYEFRDKMVEDLGLELITHINPDGIAKNINPFDHGSATHTDIMKTEGLKQALNEHKFDVAFGGARRDEEKSRAKERIFSFRTADHRWDPKNQRPEIWKQYNTRKNPGESIRVFPISNWTELDIWQYIHLENIPIVPLYYSKERPVVERDGTLIMVDDERMPLKEGEVPMMKNVRFRTLGCYPLTGAVESDADTLPAIIQEMLLTRTSERQGRMIDHDSAASMEKKKQEGYF
jgi:sulfate adenylyltransferase subunit 2